MTALTVFALVLLVVFLTGVAGTVALGVYVGRRAVRAGRTATRQLTRARTAARAALPGPAQAAHAERARVHRELGTALSSFDAARRSGRPVAPLARHADALHRLGAWLDVDLAVVAAEPDPVLRAARLTDVRPRVDTFARACSELRHGVLLTGYTHADAALHHVTAELAEQVEALDARAWAYRSLTGR